MSYPWLVEAEQQFARGLAEGRLAHAILVSGPAGLGKLGFARQAAQGLMCLESKVQADGLPPGCSCRSCALMASGAHPDFHLLTFEENEKTHKMRSELVVDQVRRLSASMQLTNSLSPYKVALVHPAEAMNRSAANALLKTLLEPPGDAVLFLVSHDPSRLPATIRSRCQSLLIRIPAHTAARDWLEQQGITDAGVADQALAASAGSPLTALQMIKDGRADQFQEVDGLLAKVEADEAAIDEAVSAFEKVEERDLWTWISLIAAERLRSSLRAGDGDSTRSKSFRAAAGPGNLARLQGLADRNRLSLSTQLRRDLLLRDWLIQWARITSG